MKTYLTLFGCCAVIYVSSQINPSHGADVQALAGISVVYDSPFSSIQNPSLASLQKQASFAFSYNNKFMLKELQAQSLVLHFPLKSSNHAQSFLFSLQHYGYSLYSDLRWSSAYSMELSQQLSLGIKLNYLYLNIGQGNFKKHRLSGDVGLLYNLNAQTRLGMSINHLNQPRIDAFLDAGYSSVILMGVQHKLSEGVQVLAQLDKSTQKAYGLSTGLLYQPHEKFQCMAGIRFPTWEYAFGFAYQASWLKLIFSFRYSQQLSWSPATSFILKSFENE
ncbi:hypothetical protein SAMN05216474_0246 [Lishizhenia tianjinensis]|uniref:Type IX secretion system membrane protein, PorP/SprF family n=1 Tax=Lishizhenia tianjinensis TaxID=477690 RepID=A0A1I6XJX9_9FLAO|nr:hypothetical protein [Lishizhenia tianjinensis]SFT38341.1 hypothetical protein SAMN05216474_0246 [Lishizhenia tianjinensis]